MATSAGSIPITATFNAAQLEKDVLSALTRIQSKSTLNLNTRNFTQPLGKITGLANEFNKSLEASNARVVAFGASAGVIFAVQKSFSALVNTTIDVEKSLTDINIVLNTSSAGIKKFGDQLFEVAKNTGSSFKDAAGAATEFSRQGLGLEETLRRTRDALILTRLSGLDVVSSTEALTSAVNSFTQEALTTTDVVNKLAAVDAKFAVSSRDLSEAIQRVGSSASEAGVSFDELLGIVTSVQQTTARGGAVIGNALKTIFTRIERPQVISDLKDFGITVADISGNTLPTIKIIENLAQSFQNLNPIVKSQVAELVGGVYQINILKAALADVSKQNSAFAEATKASSQAVDDAIAKNDALNQSLSALFNATTANFAKFAVSIGESSVAPGIRKVLDYVNSALESYNEKDSESIGKKIATGLLTGITSFVTGPGLALGALAVGKLIGNFASFAGDATKNILGLNSLGRQQAVLQGEISNILSNNPQLIQQIIAGSKSRLQVEKEIKQTLIEQAAVSEMLKKSSASIAYGYIASGLGVSTSGGITGKRGSAGGYIPAQQQASEMVGAMQGGYAPGKVVAAPKSIGGVMNTAEKVKYIPGFAQPYILPPDGSRAARNLTAKSMSQNGVDPYKSKGFVPNFGGPPPLDNAGRYGDNDYWYSSKSGKTSLSEVRLKDKDGNPDKAAWGGPDKGFYRTDGLPFTATDLNKFVRAGVTYGEIRRYLPDSFVQDDPRAKAGVSLDQLKKEYKPGAKIATVESVKEEAKRVFEPFTPPASMLIWDLAGKNSDQDEIVDLEKLTEDKKQAGRSFRIKIRALSGSPLNEEKFGLIDKTSKFARDITKKLATGIPGAKSDYSDKEVDSYFNKTGKNYNVLAGTIFEAGTNLAASYVRDQEFNKTASKLSAIGGDFDVKGGANLANVQKFFPGFTDSYGDYKLNNSYDAIREFIDKVRKEFPLEIGNHFDKQESKIAGIKTSAKGFIPNFAPKPFNFRFSSLGEKTAQISPKLRDWLADKYFDPEMASTGTLERLASLNRDSGAFFSSLENPNAVAGIPVRGQQGFISRQNRGARAGAFLNALRARLPDFVPGSLPNLASGFIPNFAPQQMDFNLSGGAASAPAPTPIQTDESMAIGERSGSSLLIKPDGTLKVSFLRSTEGNPLFSIIKGLKKGLIKKIDAGAVIGPRVPNLITGLKNALPDLRKNSPLIPSSIPILGMFSPKELMSNLYKDRAKLQYSLDRDSLDQINKYLSPKGFEVRSGAGNRYDTYSTIDKSIGQAATFYNSQDNVFLPESFSMNSYTMKKIKNIPGVNLNLKKRREAGSYGYNREDFSKLRKAFEEMGILSTSLEGKATWQNMSDNGYGEYVRLENLYPNGLSKGFIPNFNPVKEAIGREMSAGYSSSQVKVGQSSKLKTNFNPMGLGVYNSTEGSLNGGIGLAEKAGINPKTKGMSAKGHIPNFAEFGGVDFSIAIGALALFATSIKNSVDSFKMLSKETETIKKTSAAAAKAYEAELKKGSGTIAKEFAAREKLIQDEIKKTFTNVNNKLKLTGTSTVPLVGRATRDIFGIPTSSPQAASADEVARLAQLREQRAANRKEKLAQREAARTGKAEAEAALSLASASTFDSKTMFKYDSKFSNYAKAIGTPVGLGVSAASNIGGQFVSPENKTGKAAYSGLGDVASFAGLGAQFGAPGAIIGAVIGFGSAILKFKDAKAEEAIDKINKSLDETKQKSSDFSGAAQGYSSSLQGLQDALNDPKTKPEALLKFQNNLTESLSSIPEEFRVKVLKAGTDITKVTEAIAGVNKELGNTQKNIEKQLLIANIIKSESGLFDSPSVSPQNQKTLNALFSSSLNTESIASNFKGPNATDEMNTFFNNIKKQAIGTAPMYVSDEGGDTYLGEFPSVNRSASESVRKELQAKGGLPDILGPVLDSAFKTFDVTAVESIIDALKKQGLAIIDSAKRAKILTDIVDDNTKRTIAFAEALKQLNATYNASNLLISNQIDIEKNRAKAIREINKIQAEGAISVQRARIKGLLDASSPIISEGAKNNIQSQLDVNEIDTRQSSKIREASNKVLDSFSETITKRAEEARGTIVSVIENARDDAAITKERSIFQAQIQKLTPLISASIKRVAEGGNIGDIRNSLEQEIRGANNAFKPEQQEVLIQSLNLSFSSFQDTLAEIKAQGDVDREIQQAQREYQKQSLALNQRLSFAGGAQALGSTGKTGVSDLFDSLSELVSEFRQTNAIGNAAQKGSTSFKFLDILTNQLQLNRATEAPVPYKDAQSFNKQVSSDLNPLAATAIAGRVQQIRESLDLAKNVTEIQTGKSTEGTALGKAFDMAKEGAVKTALDQIASQFKLENMGNYLDVLQQEARYLNELTTDQNEILARTLPKSLNDNFNSVIRTQVGDKLGELTRSLSEVINELSTKTQTNILDTEMRNLLPANVDPKGREEILKRIIGSGDLKEKGTKVPATSLVYSKESEAKIRVSREKEIKQLQDYFESFNMLKVVGDQSLYGRTASEIMGNPNDKAVRDDYGNIEGGVVYRPGYRGAKTLADRTVRDKAIELQETFGTSDESVNRNQKRLSQLIDSRKKPALGFANERMDFTGTYKELVDNINRDFQSSMTEQDIISIKEKDAKKTKIAEGIMRPRTKESEFGPFAGGYKFPLDEPLSYQSRLPDDMLKRTRENIQRLDELSNRKFDNEDLNQINIKIEELLNKKQKSAEEEEKLLKLQIDIRNKTLEIQNKIAEDQFKLYYKSAFGNKFFKDERAAFANARIESNAREGNVDIGAITEKNTTYNKADFARDTGQLIDTFQTDFKSGIGSAFGEAIKGTKTLKDAFRDMFQGILNRMLDKSLEMGVDALFAFGKAAYATGRKDGGPIKGYNSGGMVTGGSGMKDDVPAMMSGGEYVIKKSSVDKYGSDYLRNLNGGIIPRYATGGFSVGPLQNEFLYDNPDRPTSGEFAVDSRLSAAALTDDSNPQNKLRQDRYEKLDQYLQDRAQYEADKKQSLKNYKNQVNSTFYSGLTAAAVQIGAAGLTMGAESLRSGASTSAGRGLEPGGNLSQSQLNKQYAKNLRAGGGYIAKFAGGGSTGQDNIPALLMGGEYVMNKKAVDMYGKDFMGQLNSGSLPKYAKGGMVGTSYSGQSNTDQSSSMDELVTALNTLNDNLSKDSGITQSESGRSSLAGATQESGMSVVNNISINMSQGGEVTSEANSSTQKGASNSKTDQNSMQNNGKLAELLRSKVVEVLVEQKRPGGLLYSSR